MIPEAGCEQLYEVLRLCIRTLFQMPSKAVGAALLDLTASFRRSNQPSLHNAPWCWHSFQERLREAYGDESVHVSDAPWVYNPEGTKHMFGWSREDIDRVKVFVDSYCLQANDTTRDRFRNVEHDSYSVGRKLILDAFSASWEKTWGLGTTVRRTLEQCQRGRYDVVAAHGQRKASVIHSYCFMITHTPSKSSLSVPKKPIWVLRSTLSQ